MKESEIKALISLIDDNEIALSVEKRIMEMGVKIIPFLEKEKKKTEDPLIQKKIKLFIHQLYYKHFEDRLTHWKKSEQKDLLKGMWLVATYQYPNLKLLELENIINAKSSELKKYLSPHLTPHQQVKIFNNFFFKEFKLNPNINNSYDLDHLMIHAVLKNKKGNLLILCVIYLLLAKTNFLPIYGINLPNLFLLVYLINEKNQFYINIFNQGLIFTEKDINRYLLKSQIPQSHTYFRPCSNLDILLLVLKKLSISFENLEEYKKSDEIKHILQRLDDEYFVT